MRTNGLLRSVSAKNFSASGPSSLRRALTHSASRGFSRCERFVLLANRDHGRRFNVEAGGRVRRFRGRGMSNWSRPAVSPW